jgi:capsid protein
MTLKEKAARFVASWLFDAANPRERMLRPLERLTAGALHEDMSPASRVRMVSDSRKLFANLGPAKAPIVDKAQYSFGRAWNPIFEGNDLQWGNKAIAYLKDEFYPLCDLSGSGDFQTQLFLGSVAVDRDGDVGILLTEDANGGARIQLIPSHMIGSRTDKPLIESGPYRGLRQIDGVALNEHSQPVGYLILGPADDGSKDRWVSARDLIFLYEPEWIGQVRGLPVFTHAILDLRDLRTVQGYERLASAIASSIGLVEHNETGGPDTDDPLTLLNRRGVLNESGVTTEEMGGGTVRYFRANSGSKLEFLKNERPGQAWESFMNRLIRNAYSGAGWPYELSWDSSKLGGANIRLILSKGMRAVEDRQDLFRPAAKRVVGYAIAKAIKRGRLRPSADWWRWGFSLPARLTVDYGRDSNAQRADYEKGIVNLGDILAEQGKDLDAHIAARKLENAKLRKAGLIPPGDENKDGAIAE